MSKNEYEMVMMVLIVRFDPDASRPRGEVLTLRNISSIMAKQVLFVNILL